MSRQRRALLGISVLAFILLGLYDSMLGTAWPSIRSSFSQPLAALGLLQLALIGGFLTTSTASGWLTGRAGRGRLLFLAAVVAATAAIVYVTTQRWLTLVAATALLGGSIGIVDTGVQAHLALTRGVRAMNVLHACYGLGATLGPLLVTRLVVAGWGWRAAYAVLFGLEVLLAAAFLGSRRRWDSGQPVDPGRARSSRTARAESRLTAAVPLTLALFFVYTGVEVTAGVWSFSLLTTGRGMDTSLAGLVVAGYWAALTAGRLGAALIGGRITAAALVLTSTIGTVAGTALLWWNPSNALGAIGLLITGLALAAIFPTLVSRTPAWIGAARTPAVIGWQVAAGGLGSAALPACAGLLSQANGLEALGPFLFGLSVVMLGLYVAIERAAPES